MQTQIKQSFFNLEHITSLVRQQHYMEALERYKTCLQKKPDLFPEILLSLYKELSKNVSNIQLKLLIAELYFFQQYFSDAYIELEEIYDIDKTFSQTFFVLNKLYKKTNQSNYVVPIFHDAINNDIFDSTIIDVLPKIYFDENNIDASIVLFNKLLSHQPENEHYYKTLAELYKLKGEHQKTVSIFTTLIEKSPQFLPEACSSLEDILTIHTNDLDIRKRLISFYIKSCKPNEALLHLEKLLQLSIHFKQEAGQIYKQLLDNFPAEFHIITSYISHLISNEQYTDAINQLEFFYEHYDEHSAFIKETLLSILSLNPNHQLSILHYIDYSVRYHDYDGLKYWVDYFFKLEKIPYNDLLDKLTTALRQPSVESDYFEYQCAKLHYLQKNYDKAMEFCSYSRHFSLEKEKLKLLILIDKEDFELAQKTCFTLIQKYPYEKEYYDLLNKAQVNHTQTLINNESDLKKRLILYISQADFFNAIECAQQFTSSDDNYIYTQLIICRSFFEQGRIDQAFNQISRIQIPYESNNTLFCEILFCKAICCVFLNKFNKAIQHFEEILHYNINYAKVSAIITHLKKYPLTTAQGDSVSCLINPANNSLLITGIQNNEELLSKNAQEMGFAIAENNTGVQFLFQQNHISAKSVFANALQLDNRKALLHSNMAMCHCTAGDTEQALLSIDKAISLNKYNDIYHLNKGIIYYQQDNIDLALESFQQAIRINNQNYHAIFNIAMVYYKINRLYLSFEYIEKLDHLGLYYMLLQRQFYALNQFSKSIYYWATASFDIIPNYITAQNDS